MMKAYISLPITGYDLGERRAYASRVEERLKSMGFTPVNPLRTNLPEDSPVEAFYRLDARKLLNCDAVVFCEGWEASRGCKLEHEIAVTCGIPRISLGEVKTSP